MQTIYLGNTKKIGDIDLKRNRVYTERPVEIIEELKKRGLKLADKIFVPVEEINSAQEELKKAASPIALAASQIKNHK